MLLYDDRQDSLAASVHVGHLFLRFTSLSTLDLRVLRATQAYYHEPAAESNRPECWSSMSGVAEKV